MSCAESLRVQAYFDGETDAVLAAQIEHHVEHCAECRALLEDLERTRTLIRRELTPDAAPRALRARVLLALDREVSANKPGAVDGTPREFDDTPRAIDDTPSAGPDTPSAMPAKPSAAPDRPSATSATAYTRSPSRKAWRLPSFWLGSLSGLAAAGAIAVLIVLSGPIVGPIFAPSQHRLVDDLVTAHVRSLMASHLIDVRSTDQHTVKPWFAGQVDVSPVVADFTQQGYRLIGGRADYFDGHRAAVVVYQHGPHFINVFTWEAGGHALPSDSMRNGYRLAFWRSGDLDYCAVSDTGWSELLALERLVRDEQP